MPIENAMLIICEKFPSRISSEFLRAVNEMQMGASGWQKAMENVAERYDEELLSDFVLNVSTSYSKGISIADTVSRKANDIQDTNLLKAKERAGKVTNTILLPMALFQLMPMIVFLIIPIMSEHFRIFTMMGGRYVTYFLSLLLLSLQLHLPVISKQERFRTD